MTEFEGQLLNHVADIKSVAVCIALLLVFAITTAIMFLHQYYKESQ